MNLTILKKYILNSYNFYYRNQENYSKIFNIKNEYNITLKKGKYIFITFADTLNKNTIGLKRIKEIKKLVINLQNNNKWLDEICIYNLNDIDTDFKKKNKLLFTSERYFSWIAKVYLISKKLNEIGEDDILLWIDSDIINIKTDGTRNIFSLCENSEHGIVGFHNNFWLEKFFTKRELFNYMNLTEEIYYDTQQAYGGIILFKKNKFTINFIGEWKTICQNSNLFNNEVTCKQHSEFITHKNDQSILSLLLKKNNIKTFPLPLEGSDINNIIGKQSGFFNKDNYLPLVWEPCWHNITIEEMYKNCNNKFLQKLKRQILNKKQLLISLKYWN